MLEHFIADPKNDQAL